MKEHEPLLEEHVLRRALRLDADELPPRFDPALIAAAARTPSPSANGVALAVGVAFAGGWIWSEVFRAFAGAFLGGFEPLGAAIGLVTAALLAAAPAIEAVTDPVVPIAILTAAMVAVLFHQRRPHAASS